MMEKSRPTLECPEEGAKIMPHAILSKGIPSSICKFNGIHAVIANRKSGVQVPLQLAVDEFNFEFELLKAKLLHGWIVGEQQVIPPSGRFASSGASAWIVPVRRGLRARGLGTGGTRPRRPLGLPPQGLTPYRLTPFGKPFRRRVSPLTA